ncbi:DNA helicase IV [Goodfellowiella coeruleoviolacea]|uniref:DNA helicase IV n=1 Tax=Goodfellowiella coeruleoviolacea TaxID=334858 RepID=A0AAE3GNG8_9PSEU|nr:DNA helicase IV [Goodfellowiella coeruleoviolacea]
MAGSVAGPAAGSAAAIRQAEIAVEQVYVDRVYARLAELRSEAVAMRDKGYERGHGAAGEAMLEQATMLFERDVMVRHASRLLQALDAESEGLVFGRLDLVGGETIYVGRLGIRDAEFDTLVVDWRAPAAAPFYEATADEPMGVIRRRVIRCSGQSVVDIDDDLLITADVPEHIRVVGEGALLASMTRARGTAMRDILATIQREQHEAIRAPAGGVTEITGGPGTGKTAVALHRVAHLLYRDRKRMGGAGVLVIGPSPTFMNYISRVLPSMGEDTADLRALGELLDGESSVRVDPAEVGEIKGTDRMRRVLSRAVRDTPPGAPTEFRVVYRGGVVKLGPEELAKLRRKVHNRVKTPNGAYGPAAEVLLDALWHKHRRFADPAVVGEEKEMFNDLVDRTEFRRFLVDWWPLVRPADVLGWLADPERLARAGQRVLSPTEVELLSRSWRQDGWSVADVALLDELRVLLGQPARRRRRGAEPQTLAGFDRGAPVRRRRPEHYDEYSHLVVDESQDLSPMQWRMVGRRGRYASWTLVGDPLQSSWPDLAEAAGAKDEALREAGRRRAFTLRTNYRNSAEIFALAVRVMAPEAPATEFPRAVRSTGIEPVVRQVGPAALESATVDGARELLSLVDGTVGVVTTMARTDEVRAWLADLLADERLHVVGSLESKGMEYDGVLVLEPAELIAESSSGRRTLYVALTRATQRLTVLATDPSWLPGN